MSAFDALAEVEVPALVRAIVDRQAQWVTLRFPWNPETIAVLKSSPGSKWDPERKCWNVPIDAWDAVLSKSLKHEIVMEERKRVEIPAPFVSRLRSYQIEAAEFIAQRPGALLTLQQRVGKTPTAIAATTALMGNRLADCAVVVYPNSIRNNWRREFMKWANLPVATLTADGWKAERLEALKRTPWLVVGVHYEILVKSWKVVLDAMDGRRFVVIADEIHKAKNRKAGFTQALWDLAHRELCVARWGLTGTPMRNRPRDLYGLFHFINPDCMGGYWTFAKKFSAAFQDVHGWNDMGSSNEQELAARLATVSFRKTRAEVAEWLPKADRIVFHCQVPTALLKKYQKLEGHYGSKLSKALENDDPSSEDRDALRELCKLTSQGKIPTAVDRISHYVIDRGTKVVVFAHFHESLKGLLEAIEKAWPIEEYFDENGKAVQSTSRPPIFVAGGWVKQEDREAAIDAWMKEPSGAVLLANTISSGVGLDLADAEVAIFLELEWVPADFRQAEDRIQDVHQGKRKSPPIYEYLIVKKTIDEAMAAVLLKKIRASETVVGIDVEAAGVGTALRDSETVNIANIGLPSTDKETVKAAMLSVRERLLRENDDNSEIAEVNALIAGFDCWDPEEELNSSDF